MEPFAARRHAAALAIVAIAVSAGILAWTLVTVANVNYGSPGLRSADSTGAVTIAAERPNRAAKADLARTDLARTDLARTDLARTDFAREDFAALDAFAPRMPSAILPGGMDAQLWGADDNPDWLRTGSLLASAPVAEPARSWPGDSSERPAAAISRAPPAAETPADLAALAPERLADVAVAATASARPSREPKALHAAAAIHNLAARPHRIAAAQRTYLEKIPEQGDAGDVAFRYRRRACTPGNMIDVCYMPEANRARIVVERW